MNSTKETKVMRTEKEVAQSRRSFLRLGALGAAAVLAAGVLPGSEAKAQGKATRSAATIGDQGSGYTAAPGRSTRKLRSLRAKGEMGEAAENGNRSTRSMAKTRTSKTTQTAQTTKSGDRSSQQVMKATGQRSAQRTMKAQKAMKG